MKLHIAVAKRTLPRSNELYNLQEQGHYSLTSGVRRGRRMNLPNKWTHQLAKNKRRLTDLRRLTPSCNFLSRRSSGPQCTDCAGLGRRTGTEPSENHNLFSADERVTYCSRAVSKQKQKVSENPELKLRATTSGTQHSRGKAQRGPLCKHTYLGRQCTVHALRFR